MKLNSFLLFAVVVTLFIDVQCLPCMKKNATRERREAEGPDIGGMIIQGAATLIDAANTGAAGKHKFKIKHGK